MSFLTVGSSNRRPMRRLFCHQFSFSSAAHWERTHLTSKTVFSGFMAAWFLAASPIRRSSLVKETKEGVVKLPCSLATGRTLLDCDHSDLEGQAHTDLDIGALVVGNARVGRACWSSLAIALWGNFFFGETAHQDRCQWHPRRLRRSWCMWFDKNYPRNRKGRNELGEWWEWSF